jgi:hypothetical protein
MRRATLSAAVALGMLAALLLAGCALNQKQYPPGHQPDYEAVHEMEWNLDPWR